MVNEEIKKIRDEMDAIADLETPTVKDFNRFEELNARILYGHFEDEGTE